MVKNAGCGDRVCYTVRSRAPFYTQPPLKAIKTLLIPLLYKSKIPSEKSKYSVPVNSANVCLQNSDRLPASLGRDKRKFETLTRAASNYKPALRFTVSLSVRPALPLHPRLRPRPRHFPPPPCTLLPFSVCAPFSFLNRTPPTSQVPLHLMPALA